ncbi:hypothetical protein conserved [Leishmania donovani]|uniref:Uncharacterized protein n=3 Tax=Leishmania donovani species complex TaxID=38574 RepID=A4IBY8_LEIIN|nr:conserved hypothetical protein [Leishmania infantum JPCM5]XP_003865032.1 hypothetical protein, conserved [Leishmania donovani]CAC9546928.1 hypothetical_protein_-_conserved [Leishmania infantum]AYU83255.1 hypothetical protein LdCL_350050600 [Leishmania donovani]TPP44707.1 hypothetical protein CGC21_7700 [Leishmania donovani]TPP47886.1 hypothetical protein CGC20_14500 [Leishmania donovani]CAJ1993266.1 hypothetical protein conserved [Leishmania donovani]|eukprot:XP_001469257.1 conserved hypothetical protein [Leishmania infantum JPCM5]
MSTKEDTPASLASAVDTPASLLDAKASALLEEFDTFFSQGKNTDRLRNFIEENDDTLALVASESEVNTNTEGSLRLYQLFQRYVALIEDIIEEFVATTEKSDESMLRFLASAIQEEWRSPSTAYRCVCTSYIAASMDYKDFLEFAEDLYSVTHYRMHVREEDSSEEEDGEEIVDNVGGGGGYGSDDPSLN